MLYRIIIILDLNYHCLCFYQMTKHSMSEKINCNENLTLLVKVSVPVIELLVFFTIKPQFTSCKFQYYNSRLV